MSVSVFGEKKAKVSAALVKKAARAALSFLSKETASFSVVFVSDEEIEKLNSVYRNKKRPTDILSFESGDELDLGDIFISTQSALRKAKERGMAEKDYLKLLIVHGILHLCGYDHHTKKEEQVMVKMERKILKSV